jgi:pimeloyl-ACP methyl ester carboxylesterase
VGSRLDGGYGSDGSWALGHPERVIDYGYRAVHETAQKSKAIVAAFYGKPSRRAYFEGCSDGGREALMEAQRFPADYDGLVAGAPINAFTHFMDGILSIEQALAEPGGYVAPKKLPALEAAIESACDGLDGVKDGVVSEPMKCKFDPSVLLCQGAETDRCLTAAQIATLKKIYAGPSYPGGLSIFPGLEPSGYVLGGWAGWVAGDTPGKSLLLSLARGYFTNFVFENRGGDFRNFAWDTDVRLSDEKFGAVLNATSPDLSRFKAGGGKLLIYHGWADEVVAPRASIEYYQSIAATMGGVANTTTFARLFMVPGMEHCGGSGPGPNVVDATATIDRWLETGVVPEQMLATKYVDDNPAGAVAIARPVCAYPQVAHYKGTGNPNRPASFECFTPAPT